MTLYGCSGTQHHHRAVSAHSPYPYVGWFSSRAGSCNCLCLEIRWIAIKVAIPNGTPMTIRGRGRWERPSKVRMGQSQRALLRGWRKGTITRAKSSGEVEGRSVQSLPPGGRSPTQYIWPQIPQRPNFAHKAPTQCPTTQILSGPTSVLRSDLRLSEFVCRDAVISGIRTEPIAPRIDRNAFHDCRCRQRSSRQPTCKLT